MAETSQTTEKTLEGRQGPLGKVQTVFRRDLSEQTRPMIYCIFMGIFKYTQKLKHLRGCLQLQQSRVQDRSDSEFPPLLLLLLQSNSHYHGVKSLRTLVPNCKGQKYFKKTLNSLIIKKHLNIIHLFDLLCRLLPL